MIPASAYIRSAGSGGQLVESGFISSHSALYAYSSGSSRLLQLRPQKHEINLPFTVGYSPKWLLTPKYEYVTFWVEQNFRIKWFLWCKNRGTGHWSVTSLKVAVSRENTSGNVLCITELIGSPQKQDGPLYRYIVDCRIGVRPISRYEVDYAGSNTTQPIYLLTTNQLVSIDERGNMIRLPEKLEHQIRFDPASTSGVKDLYFEGRAIVVIRKDDADVYCTNRQVDKAGSNVSTLFGRVLACSALGERTVLLIYSFSKGYEVLMTGARCTRLINLARYRALENATSDRYADKFISCKNSSVLVFVQCNADSGSLVTVLNRDTVGNWSVKLLDAPKLRDVYSVAIWKKSLFAADLSGRFHTLDLTRSVGKKRWNYRS